MDHKTVPLSVKAAGPDDSLGEGEFEGYASVFGNVDSYGDIVDPGAFTKTLEEWNQKGDPIPLLWGHDFADPFSSIGTISKAEEDDHGLKVHGVFDLENPKAQQVYKLAKGRRVTGMSFAFQVRDSEQKDGANHLKELHIYEASIVPVGANPEAGVTTVKSAAEQLTASVKAGRVLAQKHIDSLRSAQDAIGAVIAAAVAGDGPLKSADVNDDQSKASDPVEDSSSVASDEPAQGESSAASEETKSASSVERLSAQLNIEALKWAQEGDQ